MWPPNTNNISQTGRTSDVNNRLRNGFGCFVEPSSPGALLGGGASYLQGCTALSYLWLSILVHLITEDLASPPLPARPSLALGLGQSLLAPFGGDVPFPFECQVQTPLLQRQWRAGWLVSPAVSCSPSLRLEVGCTAWVLRLCSAWDHEKEPHWHPFLPAFFCLSPISRRKTSTNNPRNQTPKAPCGSIIYC